MSSVLREHRAGDRVAERYLLLRLLEIGGMGAVWIAHHLALDVHVAVKFILPEIASPAAAARLLREAQAAARVRHPAIVQIIDVGQTAEGETYLAMELLEGELLADVLTREGRLDPVTAIRVLLPIAEALDALHRSGSIHRDVKPENVFLAQGASGRWQPKLIDFGLARSTDPRASRLTLGGAPLGTPAYMSPERLMLGEDLDPQEDVYALSVVLYQAITGELPFKGAGPMEMITAITENAPRSTVDHGAGDAALWAIVARGLAAKSERWASAWDLGKALAGWAWEHGSLDDITGVSLRPVWIDDEVQPVDVPALTAAPAARFTLPSCAPEILLPPGPSKDPPALGEIDERPEDRPGDAALPPPPQKHRLTALAAGLAVLAIAGWSKLIVREARPEGPPWSAPTPAAEALPVDKIAPSSPASAAPSSPASAPALSPPRSPETHSRPAPARDPAAHIVRLTPKVESPRPEAPLKSPYD